jgi:predicted DNA-binding transcriptional regulator YafY
VITFGRIGRSRSTECAGRSTDAEKAERLNAAHSLLARGVGTPEAVVSLSRQFGLSRRQAYRYLQEAQAIGHAVPLVAPSVPITLKMPANIVRDVRAYSVISGLTLSEIVTRAITAFLAAVRGHG